MTVQVQPQGGADGALLPARGNTMVEESSWGFAEGDEIVPGVHALQLLGRARRYEAYLAWHDAMLTVVVVKILRPDRVQERSALRGLASEAQALRALDHPVLMRSFGGALDGARPHLVLEFLEGPRLSTLLRKYGPLAMEQAIPLAMQLSSAIHYMSVRGWVHLDVKPKNIIMGGPPRLIDLSVAHTLSEAATLDVPVGTDAYMAPEQCEPGTRGTPGPPADVWGLGVTLFEALVGQLPFGKGSDEDRFPQLHRERLPFPQELPPPLTRIVESCLVHQPEARPSALQVFQALEPLMAVLPTRPIIGRLKPRLRSGR
jgi:eukaryotic-like serine/threonine-protein kinase